MQTQTVILGGIILMFLIYFVIGIISYAFVSIGLFEIARREKIKHGYLAWIPYLNKYVLGRIAFKNKIHSVILTVLSIGVFLSSSIMIFIKSNSTYTFALISFILSIILSVYSYFAHYKVFKKYSKSTVLMTVLDVISCGILGPFFIFAIRDNDLKEEQ